jgi:hypothetical protein
MQPNGTAVCRILKDAAAICFLSREITQPTIKFKTSCIRPQQRVCDATEWSISQDHVF